jgi:hypothetical protein
MTEQAPAPAPAPAGGDPARPWIPTADASDPAQVIAGMRADPNTAKILLDVNHPAHQHTKSKWDDAHAGKVTVTTEGPARVAAMKADEETRRILSNPADPRHAAVTAEWNKANAGNVADDKGAEIDAIEAPPATPDGYKLDNVSLPDSVDRADDELVSTARGIAHAAQLSQAEFDGVLVAWNTAAAGAEQLSEDEAVLQLVGQLGKAETRRVIEAAKGVIQSLPQAQRDAAIELLNESGVGNNPALIKHLALIADKRAARKAKAG